MTGQLANERATASALMLPPTVKQVIQRLLPLGTGAYGRKPNWSRCPSWPPDVFAVVGTLINKSGCYAQPRYVGGADCEQYYDEPFRKAVTEAAERWHLGDQKEVQRLWRTLATSNCEIANYPGAVGPWWDAALQLLAIADAASVGIGFPVDSLDKQPLERRVFRDFYLGQYLAAGKRRKTAVLPYLPNSLCMRVPPTEVCVQPKTVTAQVGCTLRSLSHHLALLPSVGEVATRWHLGAARTSLELSPLNLLLVPFPYRINGGCFTSQPETPERNPEAAMRFFRMRQEWLRKTTPRKIATFLVDLVEAAQVEVEGIHGIVLPEGALQDEQIPTLTEYLAQKTRLEFFVSGVLDERYPQFGSFNGVYSCLFEKGRNYRSWYQSKHHRWQLEKNQIKRYHLGHALDPDAIWWERIRVSERRCIFYVFRRGASLTTLVCEDLARIDPVQAAIRAIGPNLVVALLQDGPQLEKRWPGRYATVLADDPGSAVLTLTSLGMLRRSYMPGEDQRGEVALWKQAYGTAQELRLPRKAQALSLTLSSSRVPEWTLDSRSDGGNTVRLSLSGVRGVSLSQDKLNKWQDFHVSDW